MEQVIWSEWVGPEHGPVVVLAHALGGDSSMWDRQARELARSFRVLRYDLPGHGQSPAGKGSLTLKRLASDVLELLDESGTERAHFCGLSLGGLVGQWLGLHAQERLLSLVLVDSAPRMGSVGTWNERIQQIEREGMSSVSAGTMSRWFTESFRQRHPDLVAHFKTVFEKTSVPDYIACAKVVRDASEEGPDLQRFATILVPTLVLAGKFDAAAVPADCAELAFKIPRSRYVELEAAHISPVEAGEVLTKEVLAFLESTEASR